MNTASAVFRSLRKFIAVLPVRRRKQLVGLVMLMALAAAAEMASLGALVPFLTLLASEHSRGSLAVVAPWLQPYVGSSGSDSLLAVTITFCVIAMTAAAVRVVLNIMLARLNFRIGHEIGSLIYERALAQPYAYHVRQNSAEIIGAIAKVDVAIVVVLAVLIGVSSGLIALCIIATLLLVNATVAIIAVAGFGGTYLITSRLMHGRLLANGRVINSMTPLRQQLMNEGLGGIRDVILDHTQSYHQRRFDEADAALRRAQESNQALMPLPRYVIEGIGMVVIAVIGCWFALRGGGIGAALPTLGVLVLGGQRLLPLMQQAYLGWAMISGHRAVIDDLTRLIAPPAPLRSANNAVGRMPFAREIRFEDVAFRFEGADHEVLRSANFTIPAGARVGILGPTGSGKSTLLNLLMGLLEPTRGRIMVDGEAVVGARLQSWQKNIAHVPQAIYLADASIKENVAVGIAREQIDTLRVDDSLRRAQLAPVIAALPVGVDTLVGENGIRLSGGQRQRLGIARALYKQATVLVLDEATSALDEHTEAEVMHSVESLDRDITLIMIAHRLSTLRSCDFLLRVEGGQVFRIEPSADLFLQDTPRLDHESQ